MSFPAIPHEFQAVLGERIVLLGCSLVPHWPTAGVQRIVRALIALSDKQLTYKGPEIN